MDSPQKRRTVIQSLFPRGPMIQYTFDVHDLFTETPADERASLADRIERTGHALTAAELAPLLNVSRITIFKMATARRIPSFRIGTSVRFDPKSVAEWIRQQ